ncbi:MAG: hypothetical protein RR313_05675 [Anaerovoracaceae bacterium]
MTIATIMTVLTVVVTYMLEGNLDNLHRVTSAKDRAITKLAKHINVEGSNGAETLPKHLQNLTLLGTPNLLTGKVLLKPYLVFSHGIHGWEIQDSDSKEQFRKTVETKNHKAILFFVDLLKENNGIVTISDYHGCTMFEIGGKN